MAIETTYSAAREHFKSLMDRVVQDQDVVLVRRRKGGDVALVAADELEGLLETAHLLSSPRNAERLLSALERARTHSLPTMPLPELVGRRVKSKPEPLRYLVKADRVEFLQGRYHY